jgi:hypothetical protein
MLDYEINDYNKLAEKKGLKGLLNYTNGKLVLASRPQLEYHAYQCVLATGDEKEIMPIVKVLSQVLCYDFGE